MTCHGHVERMPTTWAARSPHMWQCMTCHENPERYLRPRSGVFNADYHPPADRDEFGSLLMRRYHIDSRVLTDCSTCHH